VSPRLRLIPWWLLAAAVSLTAAHVIAATAHRLVETIIIAILLAPVAAFVIVYIVAWRMGRLLE
jgi:hypothetical protein